MKIDWDICKLEDVTEINPSIRELPSRPDDTLSVSFVPMSAVSDKTGSIVQRNIRPYGEVKKGHTYFQENDVIFAKITPCMQNGKCALAKDLENGIGFGSTEFHVLRSKGKIHPKWLHLFLRRECFLQKAEEHMQGAVGQQRLPESYLRETYIKFPTDIAEQKIILDELQSQLDAIASIEEKTRKQMAELEAWIEKLIEEKLVDSVHETWNTGTIEDYAFINPSIRELSTRPDDSLPVSFVPMPAVSDESGTIVQKIVRPYGEVKKGYTYFCEHDVIFAKITPCMQNGKCALAKDLENGIGFGSTEFHVLRSKGLISPEWLQLFLRRKFFLQKAAEHMKGAVGQQRLPESYLRETPICFPKKREEQQAIIEDVLSKINESLLIKEKLNQQLSNLSALRNALYREAFGGDGE